MSKHYLYLNEQGFPEAIDVDTGEVTPFTVQAKDLANYRMQVVDGQRRWVPLVELPQPKRYSPLVGDAICSMILEGVGIQRALLDTGITYREYCQWRRLYPEFAEMVDEARKDRAELFFEKLEAVADETEVEEDAISLGRLKADIYKHLAEVSDSGRFGKKTNINAKIGVGVIQIETGVRREGDPGFKEAELFRAIEEGQKVIEAAALDVVHLLVPNNLPKKVDEI